MICHQLAFHTQLKAATESTCQHRRHHHDHHQQPPPPLQLFLQSSTYQMLPIHCIQFAQKPNADGYSHLHFSDEEIWGLEKEMCLMPPSNNQSLYTKQGSTDIKAYILNPQSLWSWGESTVPSTHVIYRYSWHHPWSLKCPKATWPFLWTSSINHLLLFWHLTHIRLYRGHLYPSLMFSIRP